MILKERKSTNGGTIKMILNKTRKQEIQIQ